MDMRAWAEIESRFEQERRKRAQLRPSEGTMAEGHRKRVLVSPDPDEVARGLPRPKTPKTPRSALANFISNLQLKK